MFFKELTPSKALRLVAGLTVVQAVAIAYQLLQVEEAVTANEKRQVFLLDIVRRNYDRLEEFDLIALRELGLIKEQS